MSLRSTALLVLVAGLLAGCAATGARVSYPVDRGDRGVHRPAPRTVPTSARSAPLYRRADSDAQRYVRDVGRYVRLDRQQQRQVRALLHERTVYLLDRTRPVDHAQVYPFPRRAGERDRTVRRFWRDADRDIERQLGPAQRRAYRDWVREHERQAARPGARPAHPHGAPPGRARGRNR